MVDPDDLRAWLRLSHANGVGRSAMRRLLASCGSPQAVLDAPEALWQDQVGPAAVLGLQNRQDSDIAADAAWDASARWLDGGAQRQVLAWGDSDYPPLLLDSPDPPPLLWLDGPAWRLAVPSVAIVGSRQATPAGLAHAREFAAELSRRSLCVVSGLASGIDGAAHQGALDGPGGTVAVTGCGLDIVYPTRHRTLAARIPDNGALLSEHPPGTPPLAAHFPLRNRIIAGLSLGTLVVEAALKSGSLITARLALEANREVFALPGPIHARQSQGCLQLIRQGAALVTCVDDVLEALPAGIGSATPPAAEVERADAADPGDRAVLGALGDETLGLDALQARCGWPAAALSARLLALELAGRVARLPGGRFQRIGRA
ncbi:DNA-processing protein DprA [Ideonella sp. 4Y11]|uniref:DNA-processing protein DprA n=1 Tax=Ideonella aquatica TaxID=2824119 RepID=A0A940YI94_9BURK|nr:DNA-processing protein DprA [Ideonella aquatica]MBQ0959222.1 DNA-processing protein DprA [Ideonella aquatica]